MRPHRPTLVVNAPSMAFQRKYERRELGPRDRRYYAFVDRSGRRANSMCMAHEENGRIVIGALMKRISPFSPEACCLVRQTPTHSRLSSARRWDWQGVIV
jgi:hypothetical protein